MTGLEIVLEYLPSTIRDKIEPVQNVPKEQNRTGTKCIEEIRLRAGKPLILKIGQETEIIDYIVKQQEILQAFERICENSVSPFKALSSPKVVISHFLPHSSQKR